MKGYRLLTTSIFVSDAELDALYAEAERLGTTPQGIMEMELHRIIQACNVTDYASANQRRRADTEWLCQFADELRFCREQYANYTLQGMAETVGCGTTRWHYIEKGTVFPTKDEFDKFLATCGISETEFFEGVANLKQM